MVETLPGRLGQTNRRRHQPQESRILLHNKTTHTMPSMVVRIPVSIQPIICFHPRKLSTKLDALTRQWDVYLKEGGNTYETVNPQNLRLIFTSTQLMESLWATTPAFRASITMDSKKLLTDIKAHQAVNNEAIKHLKDTNLRWTQSTDGLV